MLTTLIPAQTAAVNTPVAFTCSKGRIPVTISALGLLGGETAPIMISQDAGVTWEALSVDGAIVEVTATNNAITVYGPLFLGVKKTLTTVAVAVTAQHEDRVE